MRHIRPEKEFIHSGHGFCAGCATPVVMRNLFRIVGPKTLVAMTAGCIGSNSGVFPTSPMKLASYNTPFPSLGAAASGLRAGLDAKGEHDTQVVAIGGDGGIFDIGLQSISGSLERWDDVLYLCYDNEAYMNTGVQRSSATPKGSSTTTTPEGMLEGKQKKDLLEIISAHRIPYCATVSSAFMDDFTMKIKKAVSIRNGPRFIHAISPCPVGWGFSSELTFEIERMAVRSLVFPLYEIENGVSYTITHYPSSIVPLEKYLSAQSRFRCFSDVQIEDLKRNLNLKWDYLVSRSSTNR